ncbi:hypothetical protein J0H58_15200 [bacterium]|nr:hypothetical protein [bacterium]
MAELTDDPRRTILLGATRLAGHERRRFPAEAANTFRGGPARRAETTFGWGRGAVETGLNELRSGIRRLDPHELRGRKPTEGVAPAPDALLRRRGDPHARAGPAFRTPFAYTRITPEGAREALLGIPELAGKVPTRRTAGGIPNRRGDTPRRALKARPQKRCPRPTPSSPTPGAPAPRPRPTRARRGPPSTPSPR